MEKVININAELNNLKVSAIKADGRKYYEINTLSNTQLAEDYNEENEEFEQYPAFGNIQEDTRNRRYCKITHKEFSEISNFIIKLKEVIQSEDDVLMNCEIESKRYFFADVTFRLADFLNINNFKKALSLCDMSLSFSGNIQDLGNIKGIIFERRYKKVLGVNQIGFFKNNKEYVFVGNDVGIDRTGRTIDNIRYVGNTELKSLITNVLPISKGELKNVSKHIFNFNELGIASSIMGFSSSCFLREMLYLDNKTKGPHLVICGEAGSGKSETLENIIMPIFNMNQKMSADQCTRFVNVNYAGGSNTIPFIIEEYKPSRMSKTRKDEISALLRNAYDRTPGFRGTVQQKLNKYPVVTPIVLVGEMGIEESAGLERSILVYFAKQKISIKERSKSFAYLKKNQITINKLGRGLLEQALRTDSSILIKRYEKLNKEYSSLPNRVRNSAITCMLGISVIKDLFDTRGLNFEDCTGYTINELYDAIKVSIIENVLDGNTEVKGIIDKNIEVLNDMVETGELVKGIDYQVINSGSELALNIKMLYPKLLKYISNHNLKENDKLSQNEFTKQLRHKEYFLDYKPVRFVYNSEPKNSRAYILQVSKLKSKLTIENFLE